MRWKITKIVFTLAVFAGIFSLIWLRTAIVNLKYEINELENQKVELVRIGKYLEAEKAKIYSVENIERSAKRFGMKIVKRENIIYVKKVNGPAPYKVSAKSIPWDN
jgi:cell division protein FtsL